ncbi:MAG: hypothetical protein AAFU34_19690 [Pseudomonadota bacterium]
MDSESIGNKPINTVGLLGAVAGVIAAIVAVVAAVVGAYLYIDDKYVHKSTTRVEEFWQEQDRAAEELLGAAKQNVAEMLDETFAEMRQLIQDASVELETVQDVKVQINALLGDARSDVERMLQDGQPVIAISAVTSVGPILDEDTGPLPGRMLDFQKNEDTSSIRIFYNDNLRVFRPAGAPMDAACRWAISVNGDVCPSGEIVADVYMRDAHNNNHHRPSSIAAICHGVPAGPVTLQVSVQPVPHDSNPYDGSNCATGWDNSTWLLEATELHILK